MMPRLHNPNVPMMRKAHRAIQQAITQLDTMVIEILAISIDDYKPTITVKHCKQNKQLFGVHAGRYSSGNGHYIRRDAMLHGCKITWIELESL